MIGVHRPPCNRRWVSSGWSTHLVELQEAAMATSSRSSTASSASTRDPGAAAPVIRCQWPPPSVVAHRPSPYAKPCSASAKRTPHRPRPSGALIASRGAGSPAQLRPRSRVRKITAHGACAHGAVPSTNPVSGEMKLTLTARVLVGTGPPLTSPDVCSRPTDNACPPGPANTPAAVSARTGRAVLASSVAAPDRAMATPSDVATRRSRIRAGILRSALSRETATGPPPHWMTAARFRSALTGAIDRHGPPRQTRRI